MAHVAEGKFSVNKKKIFDQWNGIAIKNHAANII